MPHHSWAWPLLSAGLAVACTADLPSTIPGGSTIPADGGGGSGGVDVDDDGLGGGGGGSVPVGCDPACGDGAECLDDVCVCSEGYYGSDPVGGCEPVPVVVGWIGSPCQSDAECDYEGGFCQDAYPSGHCSHACDKYCPDADGYPSTFCIEAQGDARVEGGSCFARCDLDPYPYTNGCRPGYTCMVTERHDEPATTRPVCVPKAWLGEEPCADLSNAVGDDDCYFEMISYGEAQTEQFARTLLEGQGDKDTALAFLDANYEASQAFITLELGYTVNANFSPGHPQPMVGSIVHYTASQREEKTIGYFVGSDPHASTHFIIGSARNGLIVQLFPHDDRTWHAGNTYNIDRFGIDFANAGYLIPDGDQWVDYADRTYAMWLPMHGDQPIVVTDGIPGAASKYAGHDYWQPYTYYQILSYVLLSRALHKAYDLDPAKIERHGDVAASRVDPGPHLPTTFLNELVFSDADLFNTPWLAEYKTQPDWISQHPEAR